ncbi:serine O-acetyltransferase [Shewanella sp. MSW]|uniref:serine O-acetyltransferase n=1 Tax=Shewanella sp. MSW TaxID=2569536 RepID=UPI0011855A29|nr:DapH/DapD/GlmU-related protein [Shewanella sp. MSW]
MFNPVCFQRFSHSVYKLNIPLVPSLITYFIRFFYSCYFPYKIKAGSNLVLGYGGLSVVIHERTVIGDNCHIDQSVTIGGTSKKHGVPSLGNDVYVGAGAKILGPIKIGNNVVIGANSVVLMDIPDNSLVVGIPARIVKSNILKSEYV